MTYRCLATKVGVVSGLAGGVLEVSPFRRLRDSSVPDHENLTLPAAIWGFRLTHFL